MTEVLSILKTHKLNWILTAVPLMRLLRYFSSSPVPFWKSQTHRHEDRELRGIGEGNRTERVLCSVLYSVVECSVVFCGHHQCPAAEAWPSSWELKSTLTVRRSRRMVLRGFPSRETLLSLGMLPRVQGRLTHSERRGGRWGVGRRGRQMGENKEQMLSTNTTPN